MIENIITPVYRQKSKIFLWPLLDIPRRVGFKPIKTYIIDPIKNITQNDYCLIAPFSKDPSDKFDVFEEQILLTNEFFIDFYESKHFLVYIFDLHPYKEDFEKFINGKYSKLSKEAKILINRFYGTQVGLAFHPHHQVNAYLNPTKEVYLGLARELGVNPADIAGNEILNPPDLEKETFDESKIVREDSQIPN